VCEQAIPEGDEIWVCADSDLNPPEALVCNVIHLCVRCATDEPRIRHELRQIAADYDDDDPDHAAALRRMAESPIVRTEE
jgi:hypothetical protein